VETGSVSVCVTDVGLHSCLMACLVLGELPPHAAGGSGALEMGWKRCFQPCPERLKALRFQRVCTPRLSSMARELSQKKSLAAMTRFGSC
jgi:hypothetical protein